MEQFIKDNSQYQKEQDQLLQTILDYRFFHPWKGLTRYADTECSLQYDSQLEIYITSSCNQKCEYCYLHKHPELYPKEYNDPKIILHNFKIFLDYLLIENYKIIKLSIFSGDIWDNQFGWDFLDMLYEYLQKGVKIGSIILPCNCSFVSNDVALQKMQQYINKYKEIKCPLIISISVDGKIVDEQGRPRNDPNNSYTDEFYERLGAFARVNNFLFHPMVSAQNIKYWKKNYEWWEQYLTYHDFDMNAIMMLEVRDGNWTDENIKDYCDFLTFILDKEMEKCNNNPYKFMHFLSGKEDKNIKTPSYAAWLIGETQTYPGCGIATHLHVRLGDLAICPCHRTAYDQYLYGYFNVEDDVITGVRAVNPVLATYILMSNILYSTPLCDTCLIKSCCLKGCLGSQIEYGKDPIIPLTNVCKFFKHKVATIIKYYREHGIINALQTIGPDEYYSDVVAGILRINDQIGDKLNELGEV